MIVAMQTERLETLEQVRGFLEGNAGVEYQLAERGSAYRFVRRTLVQFGYHGLEPWASGTGSWPSVMNATSPRRPGRSRWWSVDASTRRTPPAARSTPWFSSS